MKTKIFSVASFLIVLAFASCQKQQLTGTTTYKNISTTIRSGETYSVNLGDFSDNQSVTITKQANNFSKSETEKISSPSSSPNEKPVTINYSYASASGFVGQESIQITIDDNENDSEHNGCNHHNDHNNADGEFHHDGNHHGEMGEHDHDKDDQHAINKTIYNIQLTVVNPTTVR